MSDDPLQDLRAYAALSRQDREALSQEVAARLGDDFALRGSERHADADFEIATFEHVRTGLPLQLVPGGEIDMGFSDEEEAKVWEEYEIYLDELGDDEENWDEWQQLFGQLDRMRPLHRVRVRPMLVAAFTLNDQSEQKLTTFARTLGLPPPSGDYATPEEVASIVAASPFRLSTEAEWEYAARAGRAHQLTHLGHFVPGAESMLGDAERERNPFGIAQLVVLPELCEDHYVAGYADAPTDGSARPGGAPRVVRGGFSLCWGQEVGEWHLLLAAFRQSESGMKYYDVGARLVFDLPP